MCVVISVLVEVGSCARSSGLLRPYGRVVRVHGSHLPRVVVPLSRVLLLVLGLVWHRRCQQVHPTFLSPLLRFWSGQQPGQSVEGVPMNRHLRSRCWAGECFHHHRVGYCAGASRGHRLWLTKKGRLFSSKMFSLGCPVHRYMKGGGTTPLCGPQGSIRSAK